MECQASDAAAVGRRLPSNHGPPDQRCVSQMQTHTGQVRGCLWEAELLWKVRKKKK